MRILELRAIVAVVLSSTRGTGGVWGDVPRDTHGVWEHGGGEPAGVAGQGGEVLAGGVLTPYALPHTFASYLFVVKIDWDALCVKNFQLWF